VNEKTRKSMTAMKIKMTIIFVKIILTMLISFFVMYSEKKRVVVMLNGVIDVIANIIDENNALKVP